MNGSWRVGHHAIAFVASGRGKARCPANPDFPNGVVLRVPSDSDSEFEPSCSVALPYPAPECGRFDITCVLCGLSAEVTAAGRADDPIMIILPCSLPEVTGPLN